jgi:ubiquinone/menaquinone biosynthesis C-methylase UbiE
MRLTERVHQALQRHLNEGDLAIDATAGNGHDTAAMARLVGRRGKVIAIDRQEDAVAITRNRISEAGLAHQVELVHAEHAEYLAALQADSAATVRAIVFNLGYLPGGDKRIRSHAATTTRAIESALALLCPGGLLCVTAYRAHPGGEAEAEAVASLMQSLPRATWQVTQHLTAADNTPPVLWIVQKSSHRSPIDPPTDPPA